MKERGVNACTQSRGQTSGRTCASSAHTEHPRDSPQCRHLLFRANAQETSDSPESVQQRVTREKTNLTPFRHQSGFQQRREHLAWLASSRPGSHTLHRRAYSHHLQHINICQQGGFTQNWPFVLRKRSQWVFASLETSLFLSSSPRILWVPPPRSPAMEVMRPVGTTSWFLEPFSTYKGEKKEKK